MDTTSPRIGFVMLRGGGISEEGTLPPIVVWLPKKCLTIPVGDERNPLEQLQRIYDDQLEFRHRREGIVIICPRKCRAPFTRQTLIKNLRELLVDKYVEEIFSTILSQEKIEKLIGGPAE